VTRARRTAGAAGFTLLEVLIAFTIFAIAAVALLKLFSTELDRADQAAHARAALLLAQSKLDGALVRPDPKNPELIQSGDAAPGLTWRLSVRPYRDARLPDTLPATAAQVTATVTWGEDHTVTLTTLRLMPRE
jgi:general secretion pathway protein I